MGIGCYALCHHNANSVVHVVMRVKETSFHEEEVLVFCFKTAAATAAAFWNGGRPVVRLASRLASVADQWRSGNDTRQ